MNRIEQRLAELGTSHRKALVAYVVVGDPSINDTLDIMHELVESGVDIIELGVPFSDPSAEGPTIQRAHERALENHVGMHQVLEVVHQFRQSNDSVPLVLMGYANPIEWIGLDNFAAKAKDAGVDGILTVDVPPEESGPFNKAFVAQDLVNIFLIAPTTSQARIRSIADTASGFLYYVSLKGTTGSGKLDTDEVAQKLSEIRQFTDLPVCVGFGIKTTEAAMAVAAHADGVVIGSALIDIIADQANPKLRLQKIAEFLRPIRSALDK